LRAGGAVVQGNDAFGLGREPGKRVPGPLGHGLLEGCLQAVQAGRDEGHARGWKSRRLGHRHRGLLPLRHHGSVGGHHFDKDEQHTLRIAVSGIDQDHVGRVPVGRDFQAQLRRPQVVAGNELGAALAQARHRRCVQEAGCKVIAHCLADHRARSDRQTAGFAVRNGHENALACGDGAAAMQHGAGERRGRESLSRQLAASAADKAASRTGANNAANSLRKALRGWLVVVGSPLRSMTAS
jgi:hypothetical protein